MVFVVEPPANLSPTYRKHPYLPVQEVNRIFIFPFQKNVPRAPCNV